MVNVFLVSQDEFICKATRAAGMGSCVCGTPGSRQGINRSLF